MIVPVVVEGQSLRWYGDTPDIADNSIEFVQLEFRLPKDWEDLVVTAQFTQDKTHNRLLVGGRCYLPPELIAGPCEVSIFGYSSGEVTRGTTIPLKFNIRRSGFVSSAETPIPPTPDLYAQLIDYFSSIAGSGGGTINPEDIAAAVEAYLAKNPPTVKETDPTVPEWAKAEKKPSYTADEVGALSAETLPGAVNYALAQAKSSGEFDGKPGEPGKDGIDGKDGAPGAPGYTPQKGIDYFTPADKQEMVTAVLAALPVYNGEVEAV